MISPIVTELPRHLEPIARDTFADGTWRPAAAYPRPLAAPATMAPLRLAVMSTPAIARAAA